MVKYHTKEKLAVALKQDMEMGGSGDEAVASDLDYIKSQSVLGDFIGFLEDIAKTRQRSINASLFTQILPQIVDVITVRYMPYVDPATGQEDRADCRYPLNLTC